MKKAVLIVAGFLWFLFALGFCGILVGHLNGGAGLQFAGWRFSSGSVLIGMVHVIGFAFAAFLCFAIGAGLFARGVTREGGDDGHTGPENS